MHWVRPYLRNIQRLQLDLTKTETPDLLVAFESSMMEVELLAKKPGTVNQCLLLHYLFRTRPEMNYQQEYQKGPLHLGRVEIDFRVYAWTDQEVENYKRMREQEDFQLLGIIDASVEAAMESLGDELMRYLKEAGESFESKAAKKEPPKQSLLSPYTSVFKGFADMFTGFKVSKEVKEAKQKPKREDAFAINKARSKAQSSAKNSMWTIYHHFKKHHEMLNW